ncbi:hypothetical protein V6N12_013213 [Hibiscus sabdariffa]|uniref:Uncharacterized protein n=1 Tax=Hibiscus sabdariffa TaxID=183260 RepID=A0ABR2D5W2_9ROSI
MLCAIPQPSNDAFQDLGCTMSRGRGWCRHAGRCTQWYSRMYNGQRQGQGLRNENENPNIVAGSFFPPDVNADSYNVPPLGDPPDPSFRLDTDARDQLPPAPLFHGSVDAGIVKVLDYGDSREVAMIEE